MRHDIPNLNDVIKEAGFSHFEDGLTEQDHETLARINIGIEGIYDNFGDVDSIRADAAEFFTKLGNAPAEAKKQADIAARLVEKAVAGFGSETAWIAIRAFTPTHAYDTPRWHMDAKFHDTTSPQLKAVFALKGASTLLHRAGKGLRDKMWPLQRAVGTTMDEMESRRQREALIDAATTETTPPGCFTVIIAGHDFATVHSEPRIDEQRVFLSVLPGTKAEIKELQQRWDRAKKAEFRLGDQKPTTLSAKP